MKYFIVILVFVAAILGQERIQFKDANGNWVYAVTDTNGYLYIQSVNLDTRALDALQDTLSAFVIDPDGDKVEISSSGQLHTVMTSLYDTLNSSTTLLLADSTFTGEAVSLIDYNGIGVLVNTDVASATNGLCIQYSFDENLADSTWYSGEAYTIVAGATKFFSPPKQGLYYRICYTNGGTNQATFHLHSLLSKMPFKWSSHNINSTLNDDDDAELVAAVLKLRTSQNTYVSAASTVSGNFKVSLEELESGVSSNSNTQLNVTLFDAGGEEAQVDSGSNSLQVIDFSHHKLHDGMHYSITSFDTLATAGDSLKFSITVPDTTIRAHLTFQFEGTLLTQFYIYKNASVSGGNSITIQNGNDNSSNTSMLSLKSDCVILNAGDLRDKYSFGSGTNPANASAGASSREHEIILKNNSTYLCIFVTGANNNIISYEANWYEN